MKRQNAFGLPIVMVGALILLLTSASGWARDAAYDSHPKLDEQEMFVACADCHKEATPKIEKEWYDSVHGIAMIKCYMCHGTYETFRVDPGKTNCATCHADQIDKKVAKDKKCGECHVPHSFKAEK